MSGKPTYEELAQRVRELEKADESKRKILEETSKNTSELLSFFIKHSPIYAFLKKVSQKDSQVLYASENYIDMIGVPASQMVGKTMHELFPKEFAEKITRDDIAVINQGNNLILDEELNGRNYVTYKFPLMQDGNKYLAGYTVDITDIKRVEEELAQIFAMSLDMICIADINTATFLKVNPAFTEILGYSEEELLEKPFFDFIHPDDIDTTRTVIDQRLQKGAKVINFENRYRSKDGIYRWVSWVSHPITEKGVTISVARDITEWKQKGEALKKSKALLDATGRMARVGGWELDAGTLEVTWTDETYRIHEVPLGQKPPLQEAINFFHPEDRPQLEYAIQRALDHGEPYDMEIRFITAKGKHLWARTICHPEIIDGKTVRLMGTFQDITDRKHAERKLRESERIMRYIIKYDPNAIAVYDRNLRYIAASDRYLQDYNVAEKNIVGKHHYDVFPETPQRWKDIHQRVLEGATERNDDDHFKRPDGSVTYNRWECRPWYTANGSIGGIITYTEVTTERKLAEKALIQSRSHLRALVNSIPDLIWLKDQEGIYLSCNPMFEQFFGAKESEIAGKTDYDFVDKDLADFFRANDRIAMKTGGPSKNEEELTFAANGYSGLFETIKTPMLDHEGKIIGVLGIARDITARKKSENEIAKQRRLFETMFNTITDGVVITNTQREIQLANKGMESTFGYKPEELLGKSIKLLYADQSEYIETGTSMFDKKATNPNIYVTRYRDKSGKEFSGETFGAKLFDENGQWIGNLGIMRDITDREKAEVRLQQAQKMESIGNLAGGIAHDFNNILFPIVGMAELLMEDLAPDSEEYENAEEIYKAGKRGSDLVKQILAFSRQSEHKKIPVRVQQVLKEVLKLCRSTIPANIEITHNILSDCGMVMADPTQIHQIAMNLITNAFHAVAPTGEKIFVQLKAIEIDRDELAHSLLQPGHYVLLSVSDTGCGIDPKILGKIFDPYFSTKGQDKGTGLGLSVVHGIVKQHHGDIKVYSEVGIGTTFNVYLPIIEKSSDPVFVEKVESLFLGNERILLVDDEEPIMRLEKQILERLGYHVTSRISSVDGLEAFKANPDAFDLVITDMTMPNMTGDQFARKLLSIKPALPVIILTGFSERINQENAADFGIKGLLMKPIVKSELAKMIRQVLGEAKEKTQQESSNA